MEQPYLDFGIDFRRDALRASTRRKNEAIRKAEINEKMHGFAYSYFADLANRIVLGCSARRFRQLHGLGREENIRDYLKEQEPEKLKALDEAERLQVKLIAEKRRPKEIEEAIRRTLSGEGGA